MTIYTVDKAYVGFEALYRMTVNETYFVIREKATMKYEVVDTNININDLVGIVGDNVIRLADYVSKYPIDFRLVELYDVENEYVITFLTKTDIRELLGVPAHSHKIKTSMNLN